MRTVWFPQRPPFAFHNEQVQALDAKNIVLERPFTSLNVGTFDHFNFLNKQNSVELFKLLGIKYLFFPEDFRKAELSEGEKKDWDNLISLVKNTSGIFKENWGLNFPVFSIPDTKPRIFGVNKLIAVVGSDNIYNKFSPSNHAFVFLEDGKIDPGRLENIASFSAVLVFNGKENIDLTMSLLQEFFLEINKNVFSQWAIRSTSQYLTLKYELLNRGIKIYEFDFGKGIAFSDQKEEEIAFELEVLNEGEYLLAARTMSTGDLRMKFQKDEFKLSYKRPNSFEWFTKNVVLTKGKYRVTFKNLTGMSVFNSIALIPKQDFNKALSLTSEFLNKFNEKGEFIWQPVEYQYINPVNIKINNIPKEINCAP